MPYGLQKELDTPENNDWMEACVESVMERGKDIDNGGAVAICKRQLINKKGNKTRANIGVINELLELSSLERRKN